MDDKDLIQAKSRWLSDHYEPKSEPRQLTDQQRDLLAEQTVVVLKTAVLRLLLWGLYLSPVLLVIAIAVGAD